MAAQQTARVAITAAEMTAAKRDFRAVIKFVIAAAMIGTIWTRGEVFVATMIAKARWQLPRILPIDPDDRAAIDAANAPARARGLRQK